MECRAESLRIIASAELAAVWMLVVLFIFEVLASGFLWVALALGVGGAGAFFLSNWRYRAAAVWLVLFQFGATFGAIRISTAAPAAWSLALVVAVADVLLGPRSAIALALLTTCALLPAALSTEPAARDIALGGIVLVWASFLLTWLALRPLKHALAWAVSSYGEASVRAEEAERHRGELARTVKSLTETHERLEKLTLELDRARQMADQASALKAQFAAYISHELRTPLNLIVGFSEMMVTAPETYGGEILPTAYRGDVDAIYQSGRHLATLINDVLDLSQIDAHRMALDRSDASLADVVREAIATIEAAYVEKGLYLRSDIPDSLPCLYLDRTRVRQVLINLLGNALRFTERGGVSVSAELVESEVVVSVSDTGAGISPDELRDLFREFHQAEQSTGQESEGSGLGLAIARRFVLLHGGWMRAESEPGQGSTFLFGLPVQTDLLGSILEDEGHHFRPLPSAQPALPTVLILDDDRWLCRTLQRYLDGYRVVDVGGDQARGNGATSPAVALIVSASSRESSRQRLHQTMAMNPGVPVIHCSLRRNRDAFDHLAVADYVDKPVTRERLIHVLRRVLPDDGSATVLVVDDDHHTVRLLARIIQSAFPGSRIVRSYAGVAALEAMRQGTPDLVLLDLMLPDLDGRAVLEAMRADEALRDVPVVVITARGLEEDAVTADTFGLTCSDGLSAGELVRCFQATLDSLTLPARASGAPGRPTALHE